MIYLICKSLHPKLFKERKLTMKKILSLVLVVVMLATLALTASAATIANPFKADSNDVMFESWLDYYMWYYLTGGDANIKVDETTPVWYDQCPRCDNVAMFFEKDSKIVWTCLNKECNKMGFYPVVEPDDTTVSGIPTATCETCKKNTSVVYLTTKFVDGKYISTFFCKTCHKLFDKEFKFTPSCPDDIWCGNCHKPGCLDCHTYWYCPICRPGCSLPGDDVIDPGFTYPDYPQWPGYNPGYVVEYNCFACDKKLELQYYSNINGTYFGYYKCEAGHVYTLPYYGTGIYDPNYRPIPEGYYAVRVICGTGGTYQLSDNPYGKIGDHKLLTVVPEKGYVVSDVVLNGKSVGPAEKLFFEVEGTTVIRVYFKKAGSTGSTTTPSVPSTTGKYIISATTNGKGTIEAYKNGVKLENSTIIGADKYNNVTLKFVPNSDNYIVSDVKIDGVSIGAVKTYTFNKITESHTVTVEYKWKSPFTYIAPNYAAAVEYVTEAGILAPTKVEGKKAYFSGTNVVAIKTFAAALAEMCDVEGKLDTDDERAYWALKNGILLSTDDETAPCNIQVACRMVSTYLAYIEKINNVDFVDFDASASAKDNALTLGLATEKGYTGNRNLTRYDLAAVCYMIKNQDYSMK